MKRLILISIMLFLAAPALADQNFTTFPFNATGGTTARTDPARANDVVNIKEFGAVGDNSHDDTPNIQAAIDYAYANKRQGIYCPTGNYKTTASLFLDAPGNLRGGLATWSGATTYAIGQAVHVSAVN